MADTNGGRQSSFAIGEVAELVVGIEGPIHSEVLLIRLAKAYGIGRLQGSRREAFMRAVEGRFRGSQVVNEGAFFYLPDQLHWGSQRMPRTANGRAASQIHPSELTHAILIVKQLRSPKTKESLLLETRTALGWNRTGPVIRRVIMELISQLPSNNISEANTVPGGELETDTPFEEEYVASPLTDMGYSTLQSRGVRWQILQDRVIPRYGLEGAANQLRAFIQNYKNSEKDYSRALEEWNHDLETIKRLMA